MKQAGKSNDLLSIISIIVVAIGVLFIVNRKVTESTTKQHIKDEISEAYSQGREIDLALISLNEVNNFKYAEEYLALGYSLINDDPEMAIEYIEKAINKFDKGTPFEIKRIALEICIDYYIKNDLNDKLFRCIKVIKQFPVKELTEKSDEIRNLLLQIVNVPGARDEIINILKSILESADKMDIYTMSSYRNTLGMFYALGGNYSQAVEEYFLAISNTKDQDLNKFQVKSKIEIGNIFSDLGRLDIAEEIYRNCLDIIFKIGNVEEDIITYAYINLYEVLIYQKKYTEYLEIVNEIEQYYDRLDEDTRESIKRFNKIFLAEANINVGKFEEAENILKSINDDILLSYIDDDTYVRMVFGDYYIALGMYEKAAEIYEYIYDDRYSVMNKKYGKMLIERLINTYDLIGNKEKQSYYSSILSEICKQEIGLISRDYISYVMEKCTNEQEKLKLIEKQMRIKSLLGIIVVLSISIISKLFKAKKEGKKDGLSGINNRKTFDEDYFKKFMKCANFNLIIFDIDNFKAINDTYGHMFGDEVIIKVAKEALKAIGKNDRIYRYGGEEFVIINTSKNIDDAINLGETIRKNIEAIKWEKDAKVTVSMGISNKAVNSEVTFENADNNLYIAKKTGKNKVVY